MRQIAIAGLPAFLVLFGCTLVRPPSSGPAPATTAPATAQSPATSQGTGTPAPSTATPSGSATSQPASPPPAQGRPAPATKPKDSSKVAPQSATAGTGSSSSSVPSAPHPGTADNSGAVKPKQPVSKNAGNTPATPAGAAAEPSKPTATAPVANAAATSPARQSPPPAPTLDLGSLEQRLKETRAIGVFSKLSLKNQVDDLLDQFRAYHQRQAKLSLTELRQRYDLLLLKVLSLLQDGDPPLAAAISTSREAIWGILTDPDKFAKI
jgi:hypothetical protein